MLCMIYNYLYDHFKVLSIQRFDNSDRERFQRERFRLFFYKQLSCYVHFLFCMYFVCINMYAFIFTELMTFVEM